MSDDLNQIIDMNVFNTFSELMGTNLYTVLKKHIELSDGYLKTMHSAIEATDYKTIFENAHTLKSSSQQIGAMKVGSIAKEIEQTAKLSTPDIHKLEILVKEISTAQEKTKLFLNSYMATKN